MSAIALTIASPASGPNTNEGEDHDVHIPLSSSPASFQQQQQQQPQQVIVIHKLGCPKINWTPVAICAFAIMIFCMVAAFMLAAMNFGWHDEAYKLRGGNYMEYIVKQYCTNETYSKMARRRDIQYTDVKNACTLPDDTVVCYALFADKGCIAATYVVWPWLLSLLLMLYTLFALCAICCVWICRPTHLTDSNVKRFFTE